MKKLLFRYRYIENRLGKPSLIRETSRLTAVEAVKHPVKVKLLLFSLPNETLHPAMLIGI